MVDDRDAIGEPVGFLEVLRAEQQRRALFDQLADHLPQVAPAARVEGVTPADVAILMVFLEKQRAMGVRR